MNTSPHIRTTISRIILSAFFIGVGVLHFTKADLFMRVMPPYLPYPRELVYVSGIFEILGGIGVHVALTRRAVGYGLIALLVAVFPANIHMAVHSELFPELPVALLWIRLLFQPLIMAWVWSCAIKKSV
ncbi:MAG: hypothetical protein K2X93_03910 [Candidatus Obscuribacterales bacterium]|nr:hypothetical protein [Candidatus Obscuribacterales bacterium]